MEIADLVIVTLPLGVLKTGKVEFVPPFSAQKEAGCRAGATSPHVRRDCKEARRSSPFPWDQHDVRQNMGS